MSDSSPGDATVIAESESRDAGNVHTLTVSRPDMEWRVTFAPEPGGEQ